jgi:hypothetical protein
LERDGTSVAHDAGPDLDQTGCKLVSQLIGQADALQEDPEIVGQRSKNYALFDILEVGVEPIVEKLDAASDRI